MHNLKKVVAVIAVLAMVLGTMVTGFAATVTPAKVGSDVAGTDYETAATELAALGIMTGYPDGTFKPGNQITRTEFATLVVRALGLESAAKLTTTKPAFSDVTADYQWAWGYITVATENGIIKGYPDGTFGPAKPVTYAEAVAMLVRALGYEPAVTGTWPVGYLSKGSELGITDDVKVSADGYANRGDVAVMLDNALDVDMMEQTGYGTDISYEVKEGKTLLSDKLSVDEYKDYVVTATPKVDSSLDDNELKMVDENGKNEDTYTVAAGINPDDLLGLKVTAWEKDGDIVYFNYDEAQVLVDSLDEYSENVSEYPKDATELNLVVADDSYDIADDAVVYVDNAKDKVSALKEGQYGRFILEDGDIRFVDVVNAEAGLDGAVVKEVNTTDETISYIYDDAEESELDLTDADAYHFYLDGKEIALKDVKADDVLYVAEIDDVYYITVIRKTVEGKFDKAKSSSVTIDGTSYDTSSLYLTTYSLDNDDTVASYTADGVADMLGEDVVALLDINGQVRHLRSNVDETSDEMYGVVVKAQDYYDNIKIYVNGETKTYDVKRGSSDVPSSDNIENYNGKIVKFTLNKDGEINSIDDVTPSSSIQGFTFDKDNDAILGGNDSVVAFVTEKTEFVRSDSYSSGFDTDSLDVLAWDDIKSKTPSGDAYIVENDKNEAVYVVFVGADAFTETEAGVVLDKYRTSDGWIVKIDVFDAGEKEYVVNESGPYTSLSKGDVITFSVNADNELVVGTTDLKFDAASGKTYSQFTSVADDVYSRDGRYIKFAAGGETYRTTDKTLVYKVKFDEDNEYDTIEKSSYTKIHDGVYVVYITGDANTLKVVAYAETTTPSGGSGSTSEVLDAINAATNAGDMLSALNDLEYAPFDGLTSTQKSVIATEVLSDRPTTGYPDLNAVKAKIDAVIATITL